MSALNLSAYIGKEGTYQFGNKGGHIIVEVVIKDVRQAYGRDDFLVAPKSGTGQMWVCCTSVLVVPENEKV
jgi:hypothetical protein